MATTWDSAHKGSAVSLAKSNIMAGGTGGWSSVLGTTSKSTGKYHIEFYCNSDTGDWLVGFGDSSAALGTYPGSDTHSFGYQLSNSQIIYNNAYTNTLWSFSGVATLGTVVVFEIDLGAGLYWLKTDRTTNWNNSGTANPATGVGGLTIPIAGSLFPIGGVGLSSVITINAGALPFVYAPSSGFSAWDSGTISFTGRVGTTPTTWNPSDKSTNVTLSGGNLVATTNTTANTWAGVRSTSHYIGGGKIHAEFTVTTLGTGNSPNLGFTVGVANHSADLANYVGRNDANSVGCQMGNNDVLFSGSVAGSFNGGTGVQGHTFALEMDMDKGLFWIKDVTAGSNWNNDASADPIAGIKGYGMPWEDVYLMFAGQYNSSTADAITADFAAPFSGTPSTGYVAWDYVPPASGAKQSAVSIIT